LNARQDGRKLAHGALPRVRVLRIMQWSHRWSSLICTIFLLILCVTGLPLIFKDEIGRLTGDPESHAVTNDSRRVSLDQLVAVARSRYPGEVIASMFMDDDAPQIFVTMAPSFAAMKDDVQKIHFIRFDAHTGEVLQRSEQSRRQGVNVVGFARGLHENLFAGFPGEMFLAFMALLFVIAIGTGVALYGPYTRKAPFGTMRRARARRTYWFDLHNLLGIATLAWATVVGVTGIMNEMSTPLFEAWKKRDLAAALAPYRHHPPITNTNLAPLDGAVQTAEAAMDGAAVRRIVFPGANNGCPYHYLLWGYWTKPLTRELSNPALVDARSGQLSAVVPAPWYLSALQLSRPLHFGDYGGMPLKIIWALLDLVTIVVLGSGLYLWIARPRRERAAAAREGLHGASPVMEPAE